MDRATAYEAVGRVFESPRAHHLLEFPPCAALQVGISAGDSRSSSPKTLSRRQSASSSNHPGPAIVWSSLVSTERNEYNLGFGPEKADSLGYHKLEVRTSQKDDQVQNREGFYLSE